MRKAGFSRMSVVKEMESKKAKTRTKGQASGTDGKKTTKATPLLRFQNLVSTITMTRSLRNRAMVRRQNERGDVGEFAMSHATSPDDDDRRPNTTLTEAMTLRSDVLSRLNMSDQFRFITKPNRKFQEIKVCNIIKDVLEDRLQGCEYKPEFCQEISPIIADAIKERVKRLVFPRYKIICHVLMGQVNGQCMRSVSRCAWNEEFDNYAQYCFQTPTLYAIGVVYGVYAE